MRLWSLSMKARKDVPDLRSFRPSNWGNFFGTQKPPMHMPCWLSLSGFFCTGCAKIFEKKTSPLKWRSSFLVRKNMDTNIDSLEKVVPFKFSLPCLESIRKMSGMYLLGSHGMYLQRLTTDSWKPYYWQWSKDFQLSYPPFQSSNKNPKVVMTKNWINYGNLGIPMLNFTQLIVCSWGRLHTFNCQCCVKQINKRYVIKLIFDHRFDLMPQNNTVSLGTGNCQLSV